MAEVELPKVYGGGGVVPSFVDMGAQYHHHVVEDTDLNAPSCCDVKMVHKSKYITFKLHAKTCTPTSKILEIFPHIK